MPTLEDYPRTNLRFGPSPVHRLGRLTRISAARRSGPSARTQFRARLRRQQGPQARVPRRRRARAGLRHARVDRRGPVQPHPPGRGRAASQGLGCVLVQERWVEWPDVTYDRTGNILLSRLMGADVRLDPAGFSIGFRDSWKQALADVEARGGTPYAIPAGASDHPLGGLGFAGWAFEVADAGARARCVLRHDHRVLGHRVHPGRDGRGLRRLEDAGGRPGGSSASTAAPRPRRRATRSRGSLARRPRPSASSATCATTRSSSTSATTRGTTGSPTRRRWRRCGSPAGSRG